MVSSKCARAWPAARPNSAWCYGTAVPWVVFTNIYVALCGAALTGASYVLLGLPPRLDHIPVLVFCCTLVIYNLDRLVEPHPGGSEHERWVEAHRPILWGLTLAGAVGTIILAPMLSRAALLSLPIAGVLAVGYCLPVVRFGGRWRRLKALPGAKLILIALVWTYATMGLPILESGAGLDRRTLLALLARLFFIAAVALPFDVPDMRRDRRSGITTIPTLLGIAGTRHAALTLIAASILFSLMAPWPTAGALMLSCACVAGLVAMLRPGRGVLYFMVALDGMLLLQAGLILAASG